MIHFSASHRFAAIVLATAIAFAGNLQAQSCKINDSDAILNKKERDALDRMIAFEIDFYNRAFGGKPFSPADVNMLIFDKYSDYIAFKSTMEREVKFRSMGFYSDKTRQVVVCRDKHERGFLYTCFHELSHSFIHQRTKHCPIWINEGLACYFGNFKVSPKALKHEENSRFIGRVKTLIDLNDIDLRDFIGWSRARFSRTSFSNESAGYAIAYCITIFLLNKDEAIVTCLLGDLADGKTSIEAFDRCYEGGFDRFEKDFIAHYSARQ